MSEKNSRKISLLEYLSKGYYGDSVLICYVPDYGKVELEVRAELVHGNPIEKRTVTAEKMMYYAFLKQDPYKKVERQLYLTGARPTRHFTLMLEGEEDFDRGLSAMQKYSVIYGNKQLGCEGILVDREMWKYLPKDKIESNMLGHEGFWTGTRYQANRSAVYVRAPEVFDVPNVQLTYPTCSKGFTVGRRELVTGDFTWSPSHYEFSLANYPIVRWELENGELKKEGIDWTFGMLPLVHIPNDILVDEEKILKGEPSQLYRP